MSATALLVEGRLACRQVGVGGSDCRLGIFSLTDLDVGDVVERCYSLALPAWQANPEFTWSCGAFLASGPSPEGKIREVTPFSSEADAALLPLGWGMLYADAARTGLQANLVWHCEERDGAHWVILAAVSKITAGDLITLLAGI
mmetsp:Transcript_54822/g.177365  ORF Transcript_54822/g.177365 Transcript_54822/m.177365 type:complete len:144 (+) Transcript_54822:71-502(+)